MHTVAASLFTALLLAAGAARAEERTFSLGVRATARAGGYFMGGGGAQLRFHFARRVGLEFYADALVGGGHSILRRDVEIGGAASYDVIRTPRFGLHPLLGTCVLLATAHDQNHDDGTVSQIWWGVRAGIGAAWQVSERVTLQAQLHALLYHGHPFDAEGWFLAPSDRLTVTPMGQAVVAVNFAP